jgi:hypothetical protein
MSSAPHYHHHHHHSAKVAERHAARINVYMCIVSVASFVLTTAALSSSFCFDHSSRLLHESAEFCPLGVVFHWISFGCMLALDALLCVAYFYRANVRALHDRLLSTREAFWQTELVWIFLLELFILNLQPLPWVPVSSFAWGPQFALFMLMRVYLLLRAFKDRSTLNMQRDEIISEIHAAQNKKSAFQKDALHAQLEPWLDNVPAISSPTAAASSMPLPSPVANSSLTAPHARVSWDTAIAATGSAAECHRPGTPQASPNASSTRARSLSTASLLSIAEQQQQQQLKARQKDLQRELRRNRRIQSATHSLHVLDFRAVMKTYFHANPFTSLVLANMFLLFFCSYSVYLTERSNFINLETREYVDVSQLAGPHGEAATASSLAAATVGLYPSKFGWFSNCVWFALVTVTTVGYGEMTPVSALGRLAVSVSIIGGVIWTALLVGWVTGRIAPTPFQSAVLDWLTDRHLRALKRDLAARIIQCAWREVVRRRLEIKKKEEDEARAREQGNLSSLLIQRLIAPISNMLTGSQRRRKVPDSADASQAHSSVPMSAASTLSAIGETAVTSKMPDQSRMGRDALSLQMDTTEPPPPPPKFSFASSMSSLGGGPSLSPRSSMKYLAPESASLPPALSLDAPAVTLTSFSASSASSSALPPKRASLDRRLPSGLSPILSATAMPRQPFRLPRITQLARKLRAALGEEEDQAELRALHSSNRSVGDHAAGAGGSSKASSDAQLAAALASMNLAFAAHTAQVHF